MIALEFGRHMNLIKCDKIDTVDKDFLFVCDNVTAISYLLKYVTYILIHRNSITYVKGAVVNFINMN